MPGLPDKRNDMKDYKFIKILLSELSDSISFLSDTDVEKIISGDYQITIKIQKKKILLH